jgi:hypothetical protein
MDRRYREARGAADTSGRSDRLIGRYLQQAAAENRAARTMGGSTGRPDPYEARRSRGLLAAMRGVEMREGNAVFEGAREEVLRADA